MFMLTLLAWAVALLAARLMRSTIITGASTPFVMELPPYRLPTIKGLLIHTWERTWQYIKKAGSVILGISIIVWAMMTYPGLPDSTVAQFEQKRLEAKAASSVVTEGIEEETKETALSVAALQLQETLEEIDRQEAETRLRNSIAGRVGITLEHVSKWAGFDWRTNIALVGGFAAKEVIVSTLGTAYSLGEVDPEETGALPEILATAPDWSPVVALSLIIFVMFYAPCFVTVVCIAREAGSWKWGAFSMAFNTVMAFGLSVVVYKVGVLFV